MFGVSDFDVQKEKGFKFIEVPSQQPKAKNLILLHGMFGGLSNYDPLLKRLEGYNIFVPSIPLYDFKTREISISRLTEWLVTFCDAMNINNPILLGNSMGGHLALDYTIKFPNKVAALILTGSSGLLEKDFGSTFPRRKDRDFIRKQAGLTFYEDLINDVILDEIMEVINAPSKLLNLLAITRDTHNYNMEQYLPGINKRVLLVWGRNDEITPPKVARQFHRELPNSRLRWIDKCGHAPMMEHPETFALYLNEFLTELENSHKNTITSNYEENNSHS